MRQARTGSCRRRSGTSGRPAFATSRLRRTRTPTSALSTAVNRRRSSPPWSRRISSTSLASAPAYGRAFQPSDAAGGERTVILTHSFWTRRFGADPKIVGTVVNLTGPEHMDDSDGAYLVAGVMPRHFWLFAKRLDVLVPFRISARADDRPDSRRHRARDRPRVERPLDRAGRRGGREHRPSSVRAERLDRPRRGSTGAGPSQLSLR